MYACVCMWHVWKSRSHRSPLSQSPGSWNWAWVVRHSSKLTLTYWVILWAYKYFCNTDYHCLHTNSNTKSFPPKLMCNLFYQCIKYTLSLCIRINQLTYKNLCSNKQTNKQLYFGLAPNPWKLTILLPVSKHFFEIGKHVLHAHNCSFLTLYLWLFK